jgi:hypothetical protein
MIPSSNPLEENRTGNGERERLEGSRFQRGLPIKHTGITGPASSRLELVVPAPPSLLTQARVQTFLRQERHPGDETETPGKTNPLRYGAIVQNCGFNRLQLSKKNYPLMQPAIGSK